MARFLHRATLAIGVAAILCAAPASLQSQGRGAIRRPPPTAQPPAARRGPRRVVVPTVRGQLVFVGGYFYDPFFGPYPWWPRTAYPYWYFPLYDSRAVVNIDVDPEEPEDRAAVYVDGFYAGEVDDFNGFFQGLPLPPGAHEIVVYLEGYRTLRWNVYLQPASTLTIDEVMVQLPAGETSEPPVLAPVVPVPPSGTYIPPVTPPAAQVRPPSTLPQAVGFGTIALRVRPENARVTIDGERWVSTDEGRFTIQVPTGTHHIEVTAARCRPFATNIEVREGATVPLDVMLSVSDEG